jgi:hypothetical protein
MSFPKHSITLLNLESHPRLLVKLPFLSLRRCPPMGDARLGVPPSLDRATSLDAPPSCTIPAATISSNISRGEYKVTQLSRSWQLVAALLSISHMGVTACMTDEMYMWDGTQVTAKKNDNATQRNADLTHVSSVRKFFRSQAFWWWIHSVISVY